MEHHFRSSQAGILASSLKENEPCPVCGSLNHPQLADFDQKIVYQERFKKKQKRILISVAKHEMIFIML